MELNEARKGNYNAKALARARKFLKEQNRGDLTIMNTSNTSVNWVVDAGKVDLEFELTASLTDYDISLKDSRGDKIENWSGELSEMIPDLEDTISFIEEFKDATMKEDVAVKNESKKVNKYFYLPEEYEEWKTASRKISEVKINHFVANNMDQILLEDTPVASYYLDKGILECKARNLSLFGLLERDLKKVGVLTEVGQKDFDKKVFDLLSEFAEKEMKDQATFEKKLKKAIDSFFETYFTKESSKVLNELH